VKRPAGNDPPEIFVYLDNLHRSIAAAVYLDGQVDLLPSA